ncbi:MAG: 50S ribosomal protein L10 [Candidatus Eisenbacteria bacterium]|nr:50S ribosomal protein L10 [Candidatus Eisenbacteria bacterium]
MATAQKQQIVEDLAKKMVAAKAIILTDFTGMDVLSISELRKKCRQAGVEYKVVKNTLTKRAARGTAYEPLVADLDGPTALALSSTDEVTAARVINDFRREHELPVIKFGLVEGKVLKPKEVQRLASLPSKEVLLAQFAGALKRPLASLSYALTYKLRQLACALEEVKKTKTQ